MLIVNLDRGRITNGQKAEEYDKVGEKTVGLLFKKKHPIVKPREPMRIILDRKEGQSKATAITMPAIPYDLSSKPRFSWFLVGKPGTHPVASFFHDGLYSMRLIGRKGADKVFLDILRITEEETLVRRLMYRAVRLGGKDPYRKSDERPYMVEYIIRGGLRGHFMKLLTEDLCAYYPKCDFNLKRHPKLELLSNEALDEVYIEYLETGKHVLEL